MLACSWMSVKEMRAVEMVRFHHPRPFIPYRGYFSFYTLQGINLLPNFKNR